MPDAAIPVLLAETEATLSKVREDRDKWRDLAFEAASRSRRAILSAIGVVVGLLVLGGFTLLGRVGDVEKVTKRQEAVAEYQVKRGERADCRASAETSWFIAVGRLILAPTDSPERAEATVGFARAARELQKIEAGDKCRVPKPPAFIR